MLLNKFPIKLPYFHLFLMLINWVVEPLLLVLSIIFFLLIKVYLPSYFLHQFTFSSLFLGFSFFNDQWLFVSWVCVLPRGSNARIYCLLFWFSIMSRTFVWYNRRIVLALSSCNLIQLPLDSFFVFLSKVASIVLLAFFFQVVQFDKISSLDLSEELVDDSIHLMLSNNIFRALDELTDVGWRSVGSTTMMSWFRFVSLLSVPGNEEISSEVILDLVIK